MAALSDKQIIQCLEFLDEWYTGTYMFSYGEKRIKVDSKKLELVKKWYRSIPSQYHSKIPTVLYRAIHIKLPAKAIKEYQTYDNLVQSLSAKAERGKLAIKAGNELQSWTISPKIASIFAAHILDRHNAIVNVPNRRNAPIVKPKVVLVLAKPVARKDIAFDFETFLNYTKKAHLSATVKKKVSNVFDYMEMQQNQKEITLHIPTGIVKPVFVAYPTVPKKKIPYGYLNSYKTTQVQTLVAEEDLLAQIVNYTILHYIGKTPEATRNFVNGAKSWAKAYGGFMVYLRKPNSQKPVAEVVITAYDATGIWDDLTKLSRMYKVKMVNIDSLTQEELHSILPLYNPNNRSGCHYKR